MAAAVVAASAAIGATVATVMAADADAQLDHAYTVMAELLAARPPLDADPPPRPHLVLVS